MINSLMINSVFSYYSYYGPRVSALSNLLDFTIYRPNSLKWAVVKWAISGISTEISV